MDQDQDRKQYLNGKRKHRRDEANGLAEEALEGAERPDREALDVGDLAGGGDRL